MLKRVKENGQIDDKEVQCNLIEEDQGIFYYLF